MSMYVTFDDIPYFSGKDNIFFSGYESLNGVDFPFFADYNNPSYHILLLLYPGSNFPVVGTVDSAEYFFHKGIIFWTRHNVFNNELCSFLPYNYPTSLALDNIGKYVGFLGSSAVVVSSDRDKFFSDLYDYQIEHDCFIHWFIVHSYVAVHNVEFPFFGYYSFETDATDVGIVVNPSCCSLDYSPIVKLLGGTPA